MRRERAEVDVPRGLWKLALIDSILGRLQPEIRYADSLNLPSDLIGSFDRIVISRFHKPLMYGRSIGNGGGAKIFFEFEVSSAQHASPSQAPAPLAAPISPSASKQPHHSRTTCTHNSLSTSPPISFMFSRVSQLVRHYSRPLPNYAHNSATSIANRAMTLSTADERNTRTIHTAACLIIGDEVLGGKVCVFWGILKAKLG